jgi:hypothetical protein
MRQRNHWNWEDQTRNRAVNDYYGVVKNGYDLKQSPA